MLRRFPLPCFTWLITPWWQGFDCEWSKHYSHQSPDSYEKPHVSFWASVSGLKCRRGVGTELGRQLGLRKLKHWLYWEQSMGQPWQETKQVAGAEPCPSIASVKILYCCNRAMRNDMTRTMGLSLLAKPAPPFIPPCSEAPVSPCESWTAGAKRFQATAWISWFIGPKSPTFVNCSGI